MTTTRQQSKKTIFELSFVLTSIMNSLWIFYIYLSIAPTGSYPPADFSKILQGTADRPFVSRILIPQLTRLFSPLVPQAVLERFAAAPIPIHDLFEKLGGDTYKREAAITILLMFFSLIGFAYAQREWTRSLGMNKIEQFILPLFAQILILPFTFRFAYYYDLPQIFLISLSLNFLHRRNWLAYLIAFAIATLNKELSFTLTAVYGIYYFQRLPRGEFFRVLTWQILIYLLIRVPLLIYFSNSNGSSAPLMFGFHYYRYTTDSFVLGYTIGFFGIIAFFILKKWKQTGIFLRSGLVIFAIIFVLFFISGTPLEFRVFLDALPVLAIWFFPIKGQSSQTSREP